MGSETLTESEKYAARVKAMSSGARLTEAVDLLRAYMANADLSAHAAYGCQCKRCLAHVFVAALAGPASTPGDATANCPDCPHPPHAAPCRETLGETSFLCVCLREAGTPVDAAGCALCRQGIYMCRACGEFFCSGSHAVGHACAPAIRGARSIEASRTAPGAGTAKRTPMDWDGTGNCAMCRSADNCTADFHNDDCPRAATGTAGPKELPSFGSRIFYVCGKCGDEELSQPLMPPPALAVYGLPDGWVLDPVADLAVDDKLLCRDCKPGPRAATGTAGERGT